MVETRVAIVGSGFMAETHLTAYRQLPEATVSAVVSPSTAERFVRDHDTDADAYADLDAALAGSDVDAIDVCSPTPTHPSYVERAVDAGLPVLCEKPLAPTLEAAVELRESVGDADVPVMVGHVLRFFPQYAAAKEDVDAGRIGTPGVARARRLSPFPDWGEWYADRERSGGVFLDLAIHDFDFLRWAFGEVESVYARHASDDRFEHGTATLSFASGATGYVEASWGQPEARGLTFEFELAGSDGVLSYDESEDAPVAVYTDDEAVAESPAGPADGYVRELAEFAACARTGRDPAVGLDEAVEAIRLSTAAKRSAERGRPVPLSEVSA